ncbi:hypothetical protein C7420_107105 [Pantoea ananatis]|uniref:hypothetical protein n=1 Tax=Pantoea TaxID=53335 RepID=UPI000CF4CD5F|nr:MULTISPECIES: hypothetical protein [Pantoea]MCS4492847.1 hypothetical protein [Pantoea sp. B623]NCU08118.1 hypothetical protein [Pantoea ananatis]NEK82438.1 hypothetical protein [Pantoea ananatis]PQK73494.1 hypothetical protein CG428_15190 [Pantoea ananatis]RAR68907.1 hypothetical protein C7420_107105 [Pantoea ananatis]
MFDGINTFTPRHLAFFTSDLHSAFQTALAGKAGVDSERLRAAIDESSEHLFAAAGYEPDIFAEKFLPLVQAS